MTDVLSIHSLYSLRIVRTQWSGGGDGGAEARPCRAPVSGAPRVAMGARRGRRRRLIVLWEEDMWRIRLDLVACPPPPPHTRISPFTCHHRHPSEIDDKISKG